MPHCVSTHLPLPILGQKQWILWWHERSGSLQDLGRQKKGEKSGRFSLWTRIIPESGCRNCRLNPAKTDGPWPWPGEVEAWPNGSWFLPSSPLRHCLQICYHYRRRFGRRRRRWSQDDICESLIGRVELAGPAVFLLVRSEIAANLSDGPIGHHHALESGLPPSLWNRKKLPSSG